MYNNIKRFFIGYTATSSQIYYWDMDTKLVKTSNRVRFDEGMNDLEMQTPNYKQLYIYLGRPL